MSAEITLEVLKIVALLCQSHITDWRGLAEQRACHKELLQCAAQTTEAGTIPVNLFNCVKNRK